MSEISLEYGDVLKAYQTKCNDLLTQLMTAEARLIASANHINKLNSKIDELEEQVKKIQLQSPELFQSPELDNIESDNVIT